MIQIAVADPLMSRLLAPFRPDQLPAEAVPKHGNRTLPAISGRVPRFTVRNAAPVSRLPPLGYVPFTLPPPCRRADQKLQLPQRDGVAASTADGDSSASSCWRKKPECGCVTVRPDQLAAWPGKHGPAQQPGPLAALSRLTAGITAAA
jgi:hypothetical protein